MWTILLNFVLSAWRPLAGIIAIIGLLWLKTAYDSRLIEQGKAEVQVVFDKYKSDQAAAVKLAQDELSSKTLQLKQAEIEAQAKAEQIKALMSKELDYEIKTKIVYRDCKLPASGMQLYNRASNSR